MRHGDGPRLGSGLNLNSNLGAEKVVRSKGVALNLGKVKTWYRFAAYAVFNSILLLLLLNVLFYAIMRSRLPTEARMPETAFLAGNGYPGWREDDLKALLSESTRMSRLPISGKDPSEESS